MVYLSRILAVAAVFPVAPAIAYPGEKHDPHLLKREIHTRDAMATHVKRSLGGCENTWHARELNRRSIVRRLRTVQRLRQKRGITTIPQKWRRNLAALDKWEAVDHNRTGILDYSPATPDSVIFAAKTSCILADSVHDPFLEYIYLGDNLDDGLFAWIQNRINITADYTDNSYYSITIYHDTNRGH